MVLEKCLHQQVCRTGRSRVWSGQDQSDDDGGRGFVFLSLIHHSVGFGASLVERDSLP